MNDYDNQVLGVGNSMHPEKIMYEQKVSKYILSECNVPKNRIEKDIIINFLKELPLEKLKKLVNFQEIDFENKELWINYDNLEMLKQLKFEGVVKYTAEIKI